MADNAQEAEELLKQAGQQRRHETEPTRESKSDNLTSLEDAVHDAYEKINAGDIPENLTLRDEHLAALFVGLDESGQLEDVGGAAADALDRDVDERLDTRATVLKLLVRVGLDEVAPETIESAKEGRREFLTSQADEF